MKSNKLLPIFAAGLLFSTAVQAQNCATPPSCTSLGYTLSKPKGDGWFCSACPFDPENYFACVEADSSGGGSGESTSCPSGYLPYKDIYPYCNETNRMQLVQHGTNKACYTCKKCTDGFWINSNCFSSYYVQKDETGCEHCTNCVSSLKELVNGRCLDK